jgi:hypothetical protein
MINDIRIGAGLAMTPTELFMHWRQRSSGNNGAENNKKQNVMNYTSISLSHIVQPSCICIVFSIFMRWHLPLKK